MECRRCNFIRSQDVFWKTVEKFRGDIWNKDNGLNNKIHDLLEKELIK